MPRSWTWTTLALPAVVLASLSLRSAAAITPAGSSVVRTPAEASYDVHLRSGAAGRTWRGHGSVTFTNVGTGTLPEVYLRVWSNGVLGCDPRSIAVSNVQGGDVTDERLDCTEIEVTLDQPLGPSGTATISYDLDIVLPDEDDRFGFHRGLALAGTALPILAVRDDAGWHRAPFENLGESFYSVVGDHQVTFVTPRALDTAATGVVTGRRETAAGRMRTTYSAEDVRDFAWAAGRLRTVERSAGSADVVVSYQPNAIGRAKARTVAADAVTVMKSLGRALGEYPYPEVDVVLTGFGEFGGMEYPTIVFAGPLRDTIAHELAHQWFYGVVGNDQYHEPWLDESFATWASREPFGSDPGCRGVDWPSADTALTNDMAYWAEHPSRYWVVYRSGACMLANLSKRFGHDRFLRIVGRYVGRHHLDVARTGDFMAAIEAAADRHLDGFDAAAYWQRWRLVPA
ncbi:MAG TPA: M1 family metallopeptidase [Actinomycetota bacterium]|nr:M1 family metallopeptidase [Actinomycetota bacterium]